MINQGDVMNNKGLFVVQVCMLSAVVIMGGAALALRGSHQERKAIEYCESVHSNTDCVQQVGTWTPEFRLAFIGDNAQGELLRSNFGIDVPVHKDNYTHR